MTNVEVDRYGREISVDTEVQPDGISSVDPVGEELSIQYAGRPKPIAKIQLFNLFMLIPTLGVYRFWAITRLRRYFWSSLSVNGTKLEYTGRGRELFIGLLLVLLVLVPVSVGLTTLNTFLAVYSIGLSALIQIFVILLFPYLGYAALHLKRRYMLSRTQWRGIRLALKGSPWKFGLFGMKQGFLTIITLGIYTPFAAMNIQQRLWDNTYIGDQPISCQRLMEGVVARFWGIWGTYTVGYMGFLMLLVPTMVNATLGGSLNYIYVGILGVYTLIWWVVFFWALACYHARIYHNILYGLKFQRLFFQSSLKGSHLLWTYAVASLIIASAGIASFAIAFGYSAYSNFSLDDLEYYFIFADWSALWDLTPFIIAGVFTYLVSLFVIPVVITHRLFRDIVATTAIGGTFDPEAVGQSYDPTLTRGEGLANALDMGGF